MLRVGDKRVGTERASKALLLSEKREDVEEEDEQNKQERSSCMRGRFGICWIATCFGILKEEPASDWIRHKPREDKRTEQLWIESREESSKKETR